MCQAQDINSVLQSDWADTNVAVAKIICLDLGWHLEFRQLDVVSGNFLLVIPALRYADRGNIQSSNGAVLSNANREQQQSL